MENASDGNKNHFNIHASIIFQLGESLISDPVQALVELIKNAYDADSPYVTVKIETDKPNDVENSHFPGANGFITVKDGGEGMDIDTIKNGWLTISNSLKRDMKNRGGKTQKGRTPLGDKGLGRLGAQRLGYNLEIFTRRENDPFEYHVAFSWKDFFNKDRLEDVLIYIEKIPPTRNTGTTLVISSLKEEASSNVQIDKLKEELSKLISPYNEIKEFKIEVILNGKLIDLASFKDKILDTSEVSYTINFDYNENIEDYLLSVKGKARLSFLRPPGKQYIEGFKQLVEKDNGKRFFEFLSQDKKAESYTLKMSEEESWFVEYERKRKFGDIDELEVVVDKVDIDGKLNKANPGKFHGRIDSFDLGQKSNTYQDSSIFSESKKYIKNHFGIKVYRDGFGIRVDRDWLGLGKQWTSGRSYYGLKVENTIGYIALSAAENKNLEETTDREGFKKTPYYNNFSEMLEECVKFAGEVQQFLRRGWVKFYKKQQEEVAKIESGISPEEISGKICRSLSNASAYHAKIEDLKIILKNQVEDAQKKIISITERLPGDSPGVKDLKASIILLKEHIEAAEKIVSQVDDYLKEIGELEARVKVLESQRIILREQVADFFETASLGLTAEALSHEIHNIGDRLAKRTEDIRSYLKGQSRMDPKILSFIEHVDTSISALRKQLSHLAPSLKYAREKREKIEIFPFCREVAYFYHDRLKSNQIDVQISPNNAADFFIYINRGKLTQIFDNLFLNSEYWLCEDLRIKNINSPRINITIDKPFIRFSDNGRGIDPSVETTLFEPFVTTKGKGKGRGLGLYIVQQFLEAEGCTISLLAERNKQHRLYIFEINFTGGMDDR